MAQLYLDYNATTPLAEEVVDTISASLTEGWGNPSSDHSLGTIARGIIEKARQQCASMIGASSSEVIFTSGGTESNHMVLNSFLIHDRPQIITSSIEHDSVAKPLKKWAQEGLIELTIVQANPESHRIEPDDIRKALTRQTVLVSIMLANNETGVVQPIREIAEVIEEFSIAHSSHIRFHTDAAQAIGKIEVNVEQLRVDYLSVAGHKFYGPRIGALYVRGHGGERAQPIEPVFLGGGQEKGFRAGTENTPMIAGLGKASELVHKNLNEYSICMSEITAYLEKSLCEAFGSALHFNGKSSWSERLPNTCNFSLMCGDFTGRDILDRCKQVIAGVGAACHSSDTVGSPVLVASGISDKCAVKAIRLSVGRSTTVEDIDNVICDLKQAVSQMKDAN